MSEKTVSTPARPAKNIVALLMGHRRKPMMLTRTLAIHDLDGNPIWIEPVKYAAPLFTNLRALGWTQAEYENPDITK